MREPSRPEFGFLVKERERFLEAWKEQDDLPETRRRAAEARERRISWEREEVRRNERPDRRLVQTIWEENQFSSKSEPPGMTWEEACREADLVAKVYRGQQHADRAVSLFADTYDEFSGGSGDYTSYMRRVLPLAEATVLYEERDGSHPAPGMAHKLYFERGLDPDESLAAAASIHAELHALSPDERPETELVIVAMADSGHAHEAVPLATETQAELTRLGGSGPSLPQFHDESHGMLKRVPSLHILLR